MVGQLGTLAGGRSYLTHLSRCIPNVIMFDFSEECLILSSLIFSEKCFISAYLIFFSLETTRFGEFFFFFLNFLFKSIRFFS